MIALCLMIPSFAAEEAVNIALGLEAEFEANSQGAIANFEDGNYFFASCLTDGVVNEHTGIHQPLCWYCTSPVRDVDITVEFTLDGLYDLKKIVLLPSKFLEGENMPSSYEILVSTDDRNWVKIGEENDLEGKHYDPFVYETTEQAKFVMLSISQVSDVSLNSIYYGGLGEFEIWGTKAAEPAPTEVPTPAPTEVPTEAPTQAPTEKPVAAATEAPQEKATEAPENGGNTEEKESGNSAPVIIGICAGVVVLAVIVVIIIKSKKK